MTKNAMNRRTALSALGVAMLSARTGSSQARPEQTPRRRPTLCVYSGNLIRIPYAELPLIVQDMGYDGVDLTVMPGGHVNPSHYNVELDRAIQVFRDASLDVPMVSTNFTATGQPFAYAVLYISAELGVRFFRLGPALARNDLGSFSVLGREYKIVPLAPNQAGNNIPALLDGLDAKTIGCCFDPSQAVIEAGVAEGWEAALSTALPHLGAIALSDVKLAAGKQPEVCALGEGVIDWKKFFSALAAANFAGPISLHMNYKAANDVNAMTKDLAFARSLVDGAWAKT